MGLIDQAVAKARAMRALVGTPNPVGVEVNAIKHDRFDEWTWDDLLTDVPIIKDDIRDIGEKHDHVGDFFEDMYNMLHQGDPKARDVKEMDTKHKAAVDMANHFLELPAVQSLRLSTMHDQYATAMGMRSMKEAIREAYEHAEEARRKYEDADEAEGKKRRIIEKLDKIVEGCTPGGPSGDGVAAEIDALTQELQEAAEISQEQADAAAEAAKEAAEKAEQGINQAAKDTKDNLDDEMKRAVSFGVDPGELQRMDFDTRQQLAEKLSKVRGIEELAAMLGQAKNTEMGTFRERVTSTPDEISGVKLSGDLEHLTSGEYMNLVNEDLETDFWRRWIEKRLVTYELSGREKVGKGPIIAVVDESQSMEGAPERWAAGISMVVCRRCQREGRDFIYIGFSSAGQQFRKDFPGGKGSVDDVIDMVTHFWRGGTHYERPLRLAADIVQEYHQEGKDKPDILFITDDAYTTINDDFITEWEKVKEQTQMRVFGILLGTGQSGALEQVCDNVRTLDDVSNLDGARDIFRVL